MKKKLFTTMMLMMVAITTWAYVKVDGIYYNITNSTKKTAEVTYNNSNYSDAVLTIPETIIYNGETYSVTNIVDRAFSNCTGVVSVTIGNSVTNIGASAFENCSNLNLLTIGNSVTSIGESAFYKCSDLTSITIPNSVIRIGDAAFQSCSSLVSISVESDNQVYDSRDNCNAIIKKSSNTLIVGCKNTVIPNTVINIGGYAFIWCTGLTSITIPNSVTSIGEASFAACTGLTSVTIPNSVTSIGEASFEGCTGLTSVTIPNSVTTIEDYAFDECTGLISVTIPNSVTSIGDGAFSGCSGLSSVTIPNSVTSIGDGAFSGCSGLSSVTIPKSVTSIGESAFEECSSLSKVDISDITSWMKISFYNEKSNPLYYAKHLFLNGEEVRDLVVPNTITSILDWSFCNCLSLNSVTINEAVRVIGRRAFFGCTGLTSVTIPNSVTSIGERAFCKCIGLSSVTIPNSVTTIEDYVFAQCTGLISVTIPNSVTSIGERAFYGCTGLSSVTIPNSVTSIGESAFLSCTGLTSVTIPNSVTSIGSYAFSWCSSLNTISVESGNTVYDSRDNCNAIIETSSNTLIAGCKNTVIPNSVTSIGDGAFYGCSGLTSVTIPNSVTNIGSRAFSNCTGLTSVTIGNSVTSIGNEAFYGCKSLQSIYSENTTPPTLSSSYGFYGVNKSIPVYVPAESVQAYKAAEYWSEFTNIQGITSTSTLALTDAEPTIVAGTYEAGNVTYTRTTTAGKYATFCLPYDVAMDDISDVFSAVYTVAPWCVRNPSTGLLQLMLNKKRSGTVIAAGTPFIACAKTTGSSIISNYESVTFDETTANTESTALIVYDNNGGSVLMENTDLVVKAGGTYTQMTDVDSGKYRVFDTSANFNPATWVNCFRAYIYKDDTQSSAKISQISLNFLDDYAADVSTVTGCQIVPQSKECYNLNGQRINMNAGQKGIFIINGKKFINN